MSISDTKLDRSTFAWCATAIVAGLLPLAQTLPGWLSALLFALGALGAAYGWRGQTLTPWVRLPLTLGVAAAVLYAYGFKFGRDTGAALLVTMLALKLLETRRVRDARSVLSFALFAIMAGFLQDQAPLTLLLALLATLLVLCALASVADVALASPVSTPNPAIRERLFVAARLLALSIPLTMVGFFLFPRLGSPLWGVPGNAAEARTGLSDSMAPGDIANLYADDSPALRITFDGPAPNQNELYWRGPVLVHFDGRRWSRSLWGANLPPSELEPLGPELGYEITQEPTDRHYLIALDMPIAPPENSSMGYDRTIVTRHAQTELSRFRVLSYRQYEFEKQLRRTYRDWSTQLPATFNPRTGALIEQWQKEGSRGDALIRRALALFNAEFTYTLTPMLLGRDSVDDFIFETKQGYCEHFASAFVVMMRYAQIPARVVTGYQGGYSNGVGDYWVVRQSDAHAWAEVWLEGRGWVRVDPTSAVAPERIERGSESLAGPDSAWRRWSRPIFDASDWVRRGWNDVVLGFNSARQRSLLQAFGVPEASTSQLGIALAIGIGIALALTVGLLLRAPRGPRDPLRAAYARFVSRLAKAGVSKPLHEGPIAFSERAASLLPEAAERVLALSRRYARRRYAPVQPEPRDDAALCDDLRRYRVPPRKQS